MNDIIKEKIFQLLVEGCMAKDVFSLIIERAKQVKNKTLVFPEGEEPRIAEAVKKFVGETDNFAIVLGSEEKLFSLYGDHSRIKFLNPTVIDARSEKYARLLTEIRKTKGLTYEEACSIITDANYYACMAVYMGEADGMVSGAVTRSADVMRPAFQIIKQKKDISLASSCFIMEVPEQKQDKLGENGLMVLSDCAVVVSPDADGLHAIASSSIETAQNICGITPRVSFLSYTSFAGSTNDETVLNIKRAAELTAKKYPELVIEGDLQADASLNQLTAKTKVPTSKIAGRANVLIFPNLFAGNIGYKLIQQFSGVRAVGPIIQGLNKPVNDLSRGANAEEIYLTSLITLLQVAGQ